MKLHASGEDYLEAVLLLQRKKGMVRSVDVARHMGVSKPSVCHAVATLKEGSNLERGRLSHHGRGFLPSSDRCGPGGSRADLRETLLLYPLVDGGRCRSQNSGTGGLPHGACDQRE